MSRHRSKSVARLHGIEIPCGALSFRDPIPQASSIISKVHPSGVSGIYSSSSMQSTPMLQASSITPWVHPSSVIGIYSWKAPRHRPKLTTEIQKPQNIRMHFPEARLSFIAPEVVESYQMHLMKGDSQKLTSCLFSLKYGMKL